MANAGDVFRRTPSRGGRGRRAGFVVCFGCGGILFFFRFFFFERTRPAASMRPLCLIYLYTSNEAMPGSDDRHTRIMHARSALGFNWHYTTDCQIEDHGHVEITGYQCGRWRDPDTWFLDAGPKSPAFSVSIEIDKVFV